LRCLRPFDYIKHFLAIFIYAAFFRDPYEFKKIFRILLTLASFLGTVALVQFVWAMGGVYIFGKELTDPDIYLFVNSSYYEQTTLSVLWRYGLYRAPSLTYHAHIPGLYCLLLFTLYSYTPAKRKITSLIPLISGIIASVSRMAYTGMIFVVTMQVFRKRRWAIPLILLIGLAGLLLMNDAPGLNDPGMPESKIVDITNSEYIRPYTRSKSLEVWQDHPAWGVGPGLFGGAIASKYNSHIYSKYNLLHKQYIIKVGGVEQFWFQLIAEMGIVGVLCFTSIFITLFITLTTLKNSAVSEEMKNAISGLRTFIACLLIISLGSNINIAPVMFTYCALIGLAMGSFGKREGFKNSEGRGVN